MKLKVHKIIPDEELERVQYYVSTSSDRINTRRLTMLKALAAEVLERRKANEEGVTLNEACNALVRHLIDNNRKHPDNPASGFTVSNMATDQDNDTVKLLYTVKLEITGTRE